MKIKVIKSSSLPTKLPPALRRNPELIERLNALRDGETIVITGDVGGALRIREAVYKWGQYNGKLFSVRIDMATGKVEISLREKSK